MYLACDIWQKKRKRLRGQTLRVPKRVACLLRSYTFLLQLNQASARNKERQEFFLVIYNTLN